MLEPTPTPATTEVTEEQMELWVARAEAAGEYCSTCIHVDQDEGSPVCANCHIEQNWESPVGCLAKEVRRLRGVLVELEQGYRSGKAVVLGNDVYQAMLGCLRDLEVERDELRARVKYLESQSSS